MKNITPCLWFDSEAEEAARFYTSIFKNSRIGHITRYGEAGYEFHQKPPGSVMTIEFELNGQSYTGLNGGPIFKFNEAISLQVFCENQDEVDYYWDKLTEGGDKNAQQCGWLKDKFGLSWQVVPAEMSEMLKDKNVKKSQAVMTAVLKMRKIDIGKLKEAYEQG
jgi:predicted 3-demethylubiquinone-9 3-methyltransferase (glyoxalase superfamily)